ncbi:uncharacterized protein LOC133518354 [Cydia pomonella]|uniref:uncharacterized protein LOC133518354 n=1 Tax=Cydia pomonella TaxID=82600 RepID=UPI002ADDA5BD|nr:uncharacterized protein LOC133518354 [Cydia pomonella]
MSPLACSLLALTTLFAVSDAEKVGVPNPFCDGRMKGTEGDSVINFEMTVSGGVVTIPDKCSRVGKELVGENVNTCNTSNSKPLFRSILGLENNFGIIGIDCPTNTIGCMALKLKVMQHCKSILPPVRG